MNEIRIVNVTKRFSTLGRRTTAVDRLSLSVNPGEFFVLLGPSGCGKSTLLNLLAGIQKPTEGEIWLGKELLCSAAQRRFLSPRERNVAMVFQNYALYPHMTVYDNIAFPLSVRHTPKAQIDAPVREAARALGLEPLLQARPGELSGGQRQRVAIARAIIRQPNLFLLDEPLSNLDAQLRASTRLELKRLQRKLGVTTVYVTHDQIEAMTLGDRVAVLRGGRIEQVGTPDELYEQPSNAFVGTFIGSPPMNLLQARIHDRADSPSVSFCGTSVPLRSRAKEQLTRIASDTCLVGIRPEHIRMIEREEPHSAEGEILGVEKLGRESLVFATCDGHSVSFLIEHPPETGERVRLQYPPERLHLFEGTTPSATQTV
jgi:multiple sugar transport system ATP-binding protein